MSKSYIELTSGFRNRLLYPNAADFVVNPCEINAENNLENSNNISAAYPFYNFWSLPLNIIKRWDCERFTQSVTITLQQEFDRTLLEETWRQTDCCHPIIITDAYGATGLLVSVDEINVDSVIVTISIGCEDTELSADVNPNTISISGGNPANPPNPSTGTITRVTMGLRNPSDTGNYKPELLPMNYGLDSCNLHLDTQYINNPSVGLTDSSNFRNNLVNCCVGTASKPIFSNQISPVHTLSNMYNWKIEIDSCSCPTSIYNNYTSTGLIDKITGQCCMGKYFSGMVMTNFTPNANTLDENNQRYNECSTITISSDSATFPVNRCCDIIIPVRLWDKKWCDTNGTNTYPPDGQKIGPCSAYSTYFSINAATQSPPIIANSIGCVTACPVTDSLSFDMSPSFTSSFKSIDWMGKDTCWDQIRCEKAQYNPYIINNQSWNCLRIQGGGPTDANNAYCCSFVEMIPVPIDAKKYFSYSLPGGLSDRFKTVSSYDSITKLASFNAYDCCDSLVQRQWQRMIYWQLYARCQRKSHPQAIYDPDQLCNNDILNRLATDNTNNAWPVDARVEGCSDSAAKPSEQEILLASNSPPVVNASICVPNSDVKVGGTLIQGLNYFRIIEISKANGSPLLTTEGGPTGPPLVSPNGVYDVRDGLKITVVPIRSECIYEADDFIQGDPTGAILIDISVLVGNTSILISTEIVPSDPAKYSVSPTPEEAVKLSRNYQGIGAIRTYAVSGSISVNNGEIMSAVAIPPIGGCGCDALFDVEGVDCNGTLTDKEISLNNPGKNYKVGDKLQLLPSVFTAVPGTVSRPLSSQSTLSARYPSTIPAAAGLQTGSNNITINGTNECGKTAEAIFSLTWTGGTISGGTPLPANFPSTVTFVSSNSEWDSTALNGPQTWSITAPTTPPAMFTGLWTSADLQLILDGQLILENITISHPNVTGPGFTITVKSVTPTVFWPDIGLSSKGSNYIWNYRMRQAMPELIATANTGVIKNTIQYSDNVNNPTVDSSESTVDYSITTPPLFLMGVPYSVDVMTGGSGYKHGGYFIYGIDDCDLFEIAFGVNCGEVVDVKLTKLAIDSLIYEKLSQQQYTNTSTNVASYKVDKCDVGKHVDYFNKYIPDIIELNEMNGRQYTYNWNGHSDATRSQTAWFGGSGACIKINKSYGFFSNLGHTENTNYAHKTMNTPYGPSNNDSKGCLLFLPSVAESCNNNLGEIRNSLNFSTFYQSNKKYSGLFNTVDLTSCNNIDVNSNPYNLKYQVNSQMKFMQQYPKLMNKEVGCQYNYAEPPFNSDSSGTTPIIANYSTQDIPIYWTRKLDETSGSNNWVVSRFNSLSQNTQTLSEINQLTQESSLRVTGSPVPSNLQIVTSQTSEIVWQSYNKQLQTVSATFNLTTTSSITENNVPRQEFLQIQLIDQSTNLWDDVAIKNANTSSAIVTVSGDALTPVTNWNQDNGQSIRKVLNFFGIIKDSVVQQLVQGSVIITRNSFPGYPLNIEGIWDIWASRKQENGSFVGWDRYDPNLDTQKVLPAQCCAYEWEILPVTAPSIRPINNQLIPKSSTQEQSCWRINLRNLLLPNITLQSGSLASFYPYFYVQFTNESDVQRQGQMLQSNNPNSKPALFRCAVTDIATPVISKFLKLSGDGMYQTVKFRPNDSIKFKVFLPDGREFMTSLPDTAPPSPSNPLLQVSALFEIEHIS
jgi:hypothetical protein